MKVRQLTVCQSCRSRKLGCDGKRPSCSQCLARNRRCPGYPADLIFVSPESTANWQSRTAGGHRRLRSGARRRSKESPSSPESTLPRPLSWPVCDVLSLCALNFIPANELPSVSNLTSTSLSRICGAWVGVLPSLLGTPDENFLSPAIKALGLSIVARGHDGRAPISDALEARCVALNVLHRSIARAPEGAFNSLAAAMMCLYMSEALLPTTSSGSSVHARGITNLLQRRKPAFYASGPAHTLFTGFRPILILHSFLTRTSTFVSNEPWKAEPFGRISMTPLQILMSEASILPTILEGLDASGSMHPDDALSLGGNAITMTVDVVNKLTRTLECASVSGSNWWYTSREGRACVWFPDITTANYLTYYWAFWIICVTHIRQLREKYPCLGGEDVWLNGDLPESQNVTEQLVDLSSRVLQSMEFLTQDEMKLFGVSSAVLPFQTAFSYLKAHGDNGTKYGILKPVLEKIAARGFGDILDSSHGGIQGCPTHDPATG